MTIFLVGEGGPALREDDEGEAEAKEMTMFIILNILENKQNPQHLLVDFALDAHFQDFFTQQVKEGEGLMIDGIHYDTHESAAAFLLGAFVNHMQQQPINKCALLVPNLDKKVRQCVTATGDPFPYAKDFRVATIVCFAQFDQDDPGLQWVVNQRKKRPPRLEHWAAVSAMLLHKIIDGEGQIAQRDAKGFRLRMEAAMTERDAA
jgi:hypothetical protein